MVEEKRTWLTNEIDSAKSSVDSWPNWMRNSAHFEGRDHHVYSNTSSESCPIEKRAHISDEIE